jgi:hypothetical protein
LVYQWRCFGSPWAISNRYQPDLFKGRGGELLGVFALPDPQVLWKLLFSEQRGLFIASPILLLALVGLWWMARDRERRSEALLVAATFLSYLPMNASFNHWEGSYSFGPRYLIPAIPFLALPLTLVFERWPRTSAAVALLSALIVLTATAVTPQIPAPLIHPLSKFLLPLASGRTVAVGGVLYEGPLSVNPQGVYEAQPYTIFPPRSLQAHWNSFNLGELLLGRGLHSLLPLLLLTCVGLLCIFRHRAGSAMSNPEPQGPSR